MEAEKQNKLSEQPSNAQGKKPPVRLIAAVVLIVAAALVIRWELSPKAALGRTVHRMAVAFEHKESGDLMEYVSDGYSDPRGNTKADFSSAMEMIFSRIEDIGLKFTDLEVTINGDSAIAMTKGIISYKYRRVPQKWKYEEPPLVMEFRRENGAWRLVSLPQIDFSFNDMRNMFKEAGSL